MGLILSVASSIFELAAKLPSYIIKATEVLLAYVDPPFLAKNYVKAKSVLQSFFASPGAVELKSLVKSNGYTIEEHKVTTADGYIITIFRISKEGAGEKTDKSRRKKAVFLQHGLLACCADWILNEKENSLAFILADIGYDVWLGNVRGNTFGCEHTTLSPDSKEFCNFSFDEMAKYDLPAMIDYVLKITGQENLTYIAHSQGTTIAFAMLSEMPEYNKKMNCFIAYGPVATVGYAPSIVRYMTFLSSIIKACFEMLGRYELLQNNSYIVRLSKLACKTPLRVFFRFIFNAVGGFDLHQFNYDRAEIYAQYEPAGTSLKNVVHWDQLIEAKTFQMFDYGKEKNLKKYGQETPPEYDLKKVTTPGVLFWGLNDWLSNPVDVRLLELQMQGKSMISHCIELPQFAHFDFIFGRNAKELVYDKTVEIITNLG